MVEKEELALGRLSPSEKAAVRAFLKALNNCFPEQVVSAILFGSKARGDSRTGSDVDVLVILRQEGWQLTNAISTLAARISYEHDILLGPILIGQKRWERMRRAQFSLCRNVAREGLVLLETSALPV